MSALASSSDPTEMLRRLVVSLENGDRQEIVLQLVEIGLWVTLTPDPLPMPKIGNVSSAAVELTINEIHGIVRKYRTFSTGIVDRDSDHVAAVIERHAEIMEGVSRVLTGLTSGPGFLMVKG